MRVPEVRLVGPAGEQVGVVSIDVALRLAQEADLDLVEVAPTSKPPVAKIMDYGKFKYEEAQKAKEARRNQANTILKEVRFRLKIDVHDYETKRKRAEGFLAAGDKVKAMILFRGREQSRPDQGVRLLQRFAEDVAEFGSVESTPMIDGRNMVMVIGPHKTKAAAKAEADARRAASKPARGEGKEDVDPDAKEEAPKAAAKETPAEPVNTTPLVEDTFVVVPRSERAPARTAPPTQRTSASARSTESRSTESRSAAPSTSSAPSASAAPSAAAAPAAAAPKAAPKSAPAPRSVAPKVATPAPIVAKPANAAAMAKMAAAKPAPKKD
ncbi:translation initiation factor IF-3 [Glaciihabitans arcticus]|uniref:translation initiation factor IF-3 n=1 Tax=Glaciihabitans arcticus TaxID=2668039 RepID=UPI001F002C35